MLRFKVTLWYAMLGPLSGSATLRMQFGSHAWMPVCSGVPQQGREVRWWSR